MYYINLINNLLLDVCAISHTWYYFKEGYNEQIYKKSNLSQGQVCWLEKLPSVEFGIFVISVGKLFSV